MRQQLSLSSTSQDTHKSRQKHAKLNTKMNTITLIMLTIYPTFGALPAAQHSKREKPTPHLEGCGGLRTPNARNLPRIWSVTRRSALQTRENYLTFGGFRRARRSKRGKTTSHLEGCLLARRAKLDKSKKIR